MQQDDSDGALVARVIHELMKRDDLWPDYVAAVGNAKGLDMDFPETDARIARAWEMNGRMLDAARDMLPAMASDRRLHQSVNAAAWRAAGGKA